MFFRKKKPVVEADTQAKNSVFNELRDSILRDALLRSADAVRIVPNGHAVIIYMRVDGEWQIVQEHQQGFYSYVVQAFKKMADVSVLNKHSFQMGLILLEREGIEYDAYASFFPTRYGCRISILLQPASPDPTSLTPAELLQL